MKITDQLSDDHQSILRSLNILNAAAAAWQNYRAGAAEDCRALLRFLKVFADACHHGKEERILFPMLVQAGIPIEGGPIGVLLYEHDEGRRLIREMEQALDGAKPSDFAFSARRYSELLESHIAKEDEILFPKADELLTFDDDQSLFRRFEEVDREMGEDTHEQFQKMLFSLAQKYLSESARAS